MPDFMDVIVYPTYFVVVFVLPVILYFIHRKNPQWFSGWKIFLWLIGIIIFTWVCIHATYWMINLLIRYAEIKYHGPDEIPEISSYEIKLSIIETLVRFSPFLFFFIIPVFLCVAHYKNPQWFSGRKILFWLIGTALFSLIYMNAQYEIFYLLGFMDKVAFYFRLVSWFFLWITAIPVLLIYGVILLILKMIRKMKNKN